jgi:hypothetical protein
MGTTVADITYPAEITSVALKIVPAAGQIHLLLPDPHWLAPEGDTVGELRRWLSVSGKFVMFGQFADQRSLVFQVAAGPDLRPDNRIEIYIEGQRLQSIAVNTLPTRINVPLAAQSGAEVAGEIRIAGPASGIRQVSVAQMRIIPR